jgi:Domain of unknown function (DUF4440)
MTDDPLPALRALNAKFIHNYVTNDVPSHDSILHPRFEYVSPSGKRVARAPYLVAWATGFHPDQVVYWDTRAERIAVFGDTALVAATNKWTEAAGGKETTGMTCYTDTYIRENGKWLCVLAQLTHVAPEFWPGDDTIVNKYVRGKKVA